ncbi:MAG: hypothetical protein AAGC43_12075 [Bacteroidota bacterium]
MKKEIKALLGKYYEGNTNHQEELSLMDYFSSGRIDKEFMDHRQEFLLLASFKKSTIPESKVSRLKKHLDRSYSQQYTWKKFGQIAASILLIIGGYFIGTFFPINDNSSVLNELRENLETVNERTAILLLNQPLANERLQGVEYIGKLKGINDELVKTLLASLNNDSSENVRLALIPYLLKHENKTLIKTELIKSINRQESPLIQLEIINALIYLLDKEELKTIRTQIHLENPNELVTKTLESI